MVPVPDSNPGLVQDCETLLALRDALAGGAELDWSSDRSIAEWTGVVLGGSPLRVHGLRLVWLAGRLEGPIPSAISGLPELRVLDLYGNRLTGRIPVELGGLRHLEVLDLGSNWLTGPIPAELGNLANLTSLALGRNLLTGPIPPELGRLTNLRNLRLNDNRLVGALPPELDGLENLEELFLWRNQLEECLSTALAISARSHRRLPDWPSCEPEVYHFEVRQNAALGSFVGQIRVGDTRVLAIPSGNEEELFDIDPLSGRVTIARILDAAAAEVYRLAVSVGSPLSGPHSATVNVRILPPVPCADGVAVPDANAHPELVGDCGILLQIRETLAASGSLNWAADRPITGWQGIGVGGTPRRVQTLVLDGARHGGSIPPELGALSGLREVQISYSGLIGGIPPKLANCVS